MNNKKYLYVDFDGTIFNTDLFESDIFNILKKYHISNQKYNIAKKSIRGLYNLDKIVDYLIKHFKVNKKLKDDINNLYNNNYIFKDAYPFLEHFKNDYKIIIYTYGDYYFQKKKIESSNIDKYIDDIVITSLPKNINNNINFENGIFIDNNPKDINYLCKSKAKKIIRLRRKQDKYFLTDINNRRVIEYSDLVEMLSMEELMKEDKEKIVLFGGGTGLSCLLRGLKNYTRNMNVDLTAIVSVCDDGGSTGALREEFDILAVGDIRKVLVSLSETENTVEKLLNYRFKSDGPLNKHTVGNIMLTALTEMTGSIQAGVEELGKVLKLTGKILPVTESNVILMGKMDDGSVVEGEHNITESSKKIKDVYYKKKPVIKSELIEEIKSADLIVFSMGSLYTSLIPNLICKEIINAIDETNVPIVYVCNLFTQPGETDKFTVSDHVETINRYLGKRKINTIIANNGEPDKTLIKKYQTKEQKDAVKLDIDRLSKLVDRIIIDDLIIVENKVFRHDTEELSELILSELRRGIRDRNKTKSKGKMIIQTNNN